MVGAMDACRASPLTIVGLDDNFCWAICYKWPWLVSVDVESQSVCSFCKVVSPK